MVREDEVVETKYPSEDKVSTAPTGEKLSLKRKSLTRKLNLQNAISVQRESYLPIPSEYTILTEIKSPFHSMYFKRSQFFRKSSIFTYTVFTYTILGVIIMP